MDVFQETLKAEIQAQQRLLKDSETILSTAPPGHLVLRQNAHGNNFHIPELQRKNRFRLALQKPQHQRRSPANPRPLVHKRLAEKTRRDICRHNLPLLTRTLADYESPYGLTDTLPDNYRFALTLCEKRRLEDWKSAPYKKRPLIPGAISMKRSAENWCAPNPKSSLPTRCSVMKFPFITKKSSPSRTTTASSLFRISPSSCRTGRVILMGTSGSAQHHGLRSPQWEKTAHLPGSRFSDWKKSDSDTGRQPRKTAAALSSTRLLSGHLASPFSAPRRAAEHNRSVPNMPPARIKYEKGNGQAGGKIAFPQPELSRANVSLLSLPFLSKHGEAIPFPASPIDAQPMKRFQAGAFGILSCVISPCTKLWKSTRCTLSFR